jgi:hypothetical protein
MARSNRGQDRGSPYLTLWDTLKGWLRTLFIAMHVYVWLYSDLTVLMKGAGMQKASRVFQR